MEILYLLVPMSALLVLGILGLFAWALQGDQFEDLEREGDRIIADDGPMIDANQPRQTARTEESAPGR
jgi:cbb3-type cytochrome oxidase maturation protein